MSRTGNIWSLKKGEVAIIKGKKYKHTRDFIKNMPRLGRMNTREVVNVENSRDRHWFTEQAIGWDYEIEEVQGD